MDVGYRIKYFRNRSLLTQEQLADKLSVSAQAVSKWENGVSMPDISLLPKLSEIFGVSIDELFDLTVDQKIRRIDNRMQIEEEIEADVFREYEEYLLNQLKCHDDKPKIMGILARLYHHRLESNAKKAAFWARQAILMAPERKDCQWILQKAEGSQAWDWNVSNHTGIIDFYKNVIEKDSEETKTPLPYYYLIDNLIADARTEEARKYLSALRLIPSVNPCMPVVYDAMIALAEHDEKKADGIMERALSQFGEEGDILFECAQYYAKKTDYERAIRYYEAYYECLKNNKPRFTDPLEGIATIYEIRGEYRKAADTYKRIHENLIGEWGMSDESIVLETQKKIEKMLKKAEA